MGAIHVEKLPLQYYVRHKEEDMEEAKEDIKCSNNHYTLPEWEQAAAPTFCYRHAEAELVFRAIRRRLQTRNSAQTPHFM
mmetsp:Transcript_18091/g.13135  ORF Transcript_18091/g.13135 Transcript_18091/m.13135 type:complete len:80 (+) Transcript_18091:449-688(+)